MRVIVFKTADGREFSVLDNQLRHLGSPMQEMRDAVPSQFRSAIDWKGVFAGELSLETNGVPDAYAPALAARRKASATSFAGEWPRPAATPRLSSAGIPDGYATALAKRRGEA